MLDISKKLIYPFTYLLLLLLMLGIGCKFVPVESPVQTITAESISSETLSPTMSDFPTISQTLSSTVTALLTQVQKPSLTPIPTNSQIPSATSSKFPTTTLVEPTLTPSVVPSVELPTSTPLPTYSAAEAKAIISELLLNNGNCRFPCWWGFRPGETSVQSVRPFLERFDGVSIITIFYEFVGGTHLRLSENSSHLNISFDVIFNQRTPNKVNGFYVRIWSVEGDFETGWNNTSFVPLLQAYSLTEILSTYGQPTNALIHGNTGWPAFEFILDYANRGFSIWYSASLERVGANYVGCMDNAILNLHLWDPELGYTWAEGVTRTSGGEDWEITALNGLFLTLDEATSLTLDEFYETFKDHDNISCLETPVELWPGP
ncbi:MAG: hypothetical protein ACE5GO_08855 [Anaerolineales bacterium]